jgi:deoxyribonuclease-4
MNNLNLGISVVLPIDNKILNEIQTLNSLQIMFSKTTISKKEISNIKKITKHFQYLFIHASYQINLGLEPILINDMLYNPTLDIFLNEIITAIKISANGIIVHMGKNVKKQFEPEHIYNNMINFVIQLFNIIDTKNIISKNPNFLILFETPAGQGGEMCVDLDELIKFIQTFKHTKFYKNIGLCIDTCHIFQAGYNLNNSQEIKKIHTMLEPIKDKIKLIHLNNSKNDVGKKIDRHSQLNSGKIKVNNLIKFILPFLNLPLILETIPPYKQQIDCLTNI